MTMERLNSYLISQSLGFHGQPLQKVWEGERGENDLNRIGVNPDYSTYQIRQKTLTFQDRAKRLKLHQFIAKKANSLFDARLVTSIAPTKKTPGSYATLPYYEIFLNVDKNRRQRQFYTAVNVGDTVFGSVANRTPVGFVIKVLCTSGDSPRYTADLNIKAFIMSKSVIPAMDKKMGQRLFTVDDLVRCEVVEIVPDADKMIVTMKGSNPDIEYGLIQASDFPESYKIVNNLSGETYEDLLEKSAPFNNPYCIDVLQQELGLDIYENYSNMSSLRGRFPQQDYANELRQKQASKWAFRSVAEGIEHFKEGRHSEAFQCLNKALSIDPRNVEGLVARGALYANSGSFKKAVDDFETALKLNPSHANARKYMGETLVALGRSYEEENKLDEAKKAYQDCLIIIPHHEEAQNSLEFLMKTKSQKQLIEPGELMLPGKLMDRDGASSSRRGGGGGGSSGGVGGDIDHKKDKKSKKKKSKGNKKDRKSSSSSSASESSESSDSSSESSSSSDTSSSTGSDSNSTSKAKRKSKKSSRQKSMSPLSKRMALMTDGISSGIGGIMAGGSGVDHTAFQFNQFGECSASNQESGLDDYELKVRKFLEITRDEDDYEEKVRKFVEEASKYRKERKIMEEKTKKKKKKEAKKIKKESKKRRREKDREEKKKAKLASKQKNESKLDLDAIENQKIREALKIFENFPVLDEIGTKLTSLLEKNNSGRGFDGDLKLEKTGNTSKSFGHESSSYPSMAEEHAGKWKMSFAKDKLGRQETHTSGSKGIGKQYAFNNESDSDDDRNMPYGGSHQHQPPPPQLNLDKSRKRTPPRGSKYSDHSQPPPKSVVKSGPVVLDKFGNFRLATMETTVGKPPEPPGSPKRSSRSRSRSRPPRKYSNSRSRSRSLGRKRTDRSRSGSYRRSRSRSFRSRTRSRTRSYSRSRSRSRDRRYSGGDRRPFRGGGSNRGGSSSYNKRGTYYEPRFGGPIRGRGRASYRDYRDFRSDRGRDRGGGRSFSTRSRSARGGGGPNRYYRGHREDSRERRYSRDRSEERDRRSFSNERPRSPPRGGSLDEPPSTNKKSPRSPGRSSYRKEDPIKLPNIEGRWADKHDSEQNDLNLDTIEEVISKAKKESKEEMIERNKDLVKKPGSLW